MNMFSLLFEKNPIPMWIYDLETLRFIEVNEAAQIHYGYTKEEFLSMTIKDIRPKEDVPILLKHLESGSKGYENAGYWKHIKKNGNLIYVEIISQVIDYKGYKAEIILSLDQTERFHALENLKKNESKLNSILQSMNDIVWSSDPNTGEILFINQNVINIYGYSSDEFYEDSVLWEKCIHPEDRERAVNAFGEINQKGSYLAEYRIVSKDGSIYHVRDAAKLIFDTDSNEVIRIDGILRDITKDKEQLKKISELTEDLKRQNDQLKQLAYINSHKMRGPLTSITGAIEVLENWDSDPDLLNKIRESANKLDNVIKETAGSLSVHLMEDEFKKTEAKAVHLVLHIDDDPLQLLISKKIISKFKSSLELLSFSEGREALKFMEGEMPDLIFLDLDMPVMNGWAFLDAMTNLHFETDVYILSSSIDPNDKRKARDYKNVKGYVSKPISPEILQEIMG